MPEAQADYPGTLLSLHDAEGRLRLYFRVAEEGTVEIQVLDENGETVKDLTK